MIQPEIYIGLLSGTSVDAIDVAVFSISTISEQNNSKQDSLVQNNSLDNNLAVNHIALHSSLSYEIHTNLKKRLNQLITSPSITLYELGSINRELGIVFAEAVMAILNQEKLKAKDITAIGFHGQTVFHHPVLPFNFSMQIGDPNSIREITQIPVITDFRQRDMIHGGQGAPLAPLFHRAFFHNPKVNRAIMNIGGIANISLLPKSDDANNIASDVGPGNTLLDRHFVENNPDTYSYDKNGEYAKSGKVSSELLKNLLNDAYFSKAWPKSTGREYFNLAWLNNYLKNIPKLTPQDVQATLLELTATVIAQSIPKNFEELYLCGGGAFNTALVTRIKELLPSVLVSTTAQLGIPEEWVEAGLFAWLAYCNKNGHKFNLSNVTGNSQQLSTLGCIYN